MTQRPLCRSGRKSRNTIETEETAKPPPPPTFNRPYNYKPKQIKNNNEMVCQQYPHCT